MNNVEPLDSCFFGDSKIDYLAAKNANCNGILWKNNIKFPEIHDLVNKSLNSLVS